MERIIHYTSNGIWERIKEEGFLLPKSSPNKTTLKLSDRVNNITHGNLYLVGIQKPLCDGWVRYGLMDYLLKNTSDEVILNVPILDSEKSFVRDHAHLSPKRFKDEYEEDLWKGYWKGKINFYDSRFIEAVNTYFESTISLKDYDGSYLAPEIWLSQKTPVSKLTEI